MLYLLLALAGALPLEAYQIDPNDLSRAGTDGPYVFYRNNQALIKSVREVDTQAVLHAFTYRSAAFMTLSCHVAETGDRFSFRIASEHPVDPTVQELPSKIKVVSDIEGNFAAFKMSLLGAGVINERFEWTYGEGHLVLLGDFFDRGLQVTECLWLSYKLDQEAREAGGRVHFILGNHEIMNLAGTTHYVRRKYHENAKIMGENYVDLYAANTELGRWLRTKNTVLKLGDYVFCHAGISPELAKSGLAFERINEVGRAYLGVNLSEVNHPEAHALFNQQTGIYWYRKAARNKMREDELNEALQYAQAKYMVIGHTLVPEITAYYGGRVICVDIIHEDFMRQGNMPYLLIHKGQPLVGFSHGESQPLASPTSALYGKDY